MDIHVLPVLSDNYSYLVISGSDAIIIDPGDADVVLKALQQHKAQLAKILITHKHWDHIEGVLPLKNATGATVYGPGNSGIPGLDVPVREGDAISFGRARFKVLETPGHGDRDLSFLLKRPDEQDALFCGDTLFVGGCGRVMQGTVEQLWTSLQQLATLSDATEVYCGHEYTADNFRFAASMEPDNPAWKIRLKTVQDILHNGRFSVPSTIANEKKSNIFLQAASLDRFAALRKKKNQF